MILICSSRKTRIYPDLSTDPPKPTRIFPQNRSKRVSRSRKFPWRNISPSPNGEVAAGTAGSDRRQRTQAKVQNIPHRLVTALGALPTAPHRYRRSADRRPVLAQADRCCALYDPHRSDCQSCPKRLPQPGSRRGHPLHQHGAPQICLPRHLRPGLRRT